MRYFTCETFPLAIGALDARLLAMAERIRSVQEPLARLRMLVRVLRAECPWDRQQTIASLRPYTLEEAHELLDAAQLAEEEENWKALCEELGDLLFHIAFYAQLAEEKGVFSLEEVIDALIEKMIARHPHVFANHPSPPDWHAQKKRTSRLDGIARTLPALKRAQILQQRAAKAGFDWPDVQGALEKLKEEAEELAEAASRSERPSRIEEELGDLLFSIVNIARHLGVDAEIALLRANEKFEKRFRRLEKLAKAKGLRLEEMTLDELDALYEQIKEEADGESRKKAHR